MFVTNEKVDRSFLADDLKDFLVQHNHLVERYIEVKKELMDQPVEFDAFSHALRIHLYQIRELRMYIERFASWEETDAPTEHPIVNAQSKLSQTFQFPTALQELLEKEKALILEYVRGINSFTKVDGMEPLLKSQVTQLQQLVRDLTVLMRQGETTVNPDES